MSTPTSRTSSHRRMILTAKRPSRLTSGASAPPRMIKLIRAAKEKPNLNPSLKGRTFPHPSLQGGAGGRPAKGAFGLFFFVKMRAYLIFFAIYLVLPIFCSNFAADLRYYIVYHIYVLV